MDENYIVPSLIYNAVEEAGYKIPMLIISGYQCNDMIDQGKMGGSGCFEESTKRAYAMIQNMTLSHSVRDLFLLLDLIVDLSTG